MKKPVGCGRLQYDPTYNYSSGVLIGTNWYEETVKYIDTLFKHDSTYNTDYTGEPVDKKIAETEYWTNVVIGDGKGREKLFDHEKDEYLQNYSATTDLVYNWLPHCPKTKKVFSTIHRTYIPQQDLALNHGNVTNFDLRKVKKIKWKYETSTGTDTYTTEVRDNYLKPDQSAYTLQRKAVPREISSKLHDVNNILKDYQVRGRHINLAPDFKLNVQKRDWPHFQF